MSSFDPDALGAAYDAAREREDAGDIEAAAALFRQCLAMDPDDHCGVAMRLAAHGHAAPDRAPPAYVATLFDQTAERFDEVLVRRLGYDVPAMARRLVEPLVEPPIRILDLGCGTGLAGVAFHDLAGEIVGVDLAEGMLALADERSVYDDLYVGEAVAFMAGWDLAPFDLIVAADVLPYLGDLRPFAEAAHGALAPGGRLAASTERAAEGWRVTNTQRFAHASDYLTATFEAAGLSTLSRQDITVRFEEGQRVAGDLILSQRAG